MTTLKRTLIILLAALAIVAGVFGLAQTGGLAGLAARGEGRHGPGEFRPEGDQGVEPRLPPAGADFQRPEGFERPEGFRPEGFRGEGRESGGWFGLTDIVKNLVIVAVIILAVAGLSRAGEAWQRRRPAAQRTQ